MLVSAQRRARLDARQSRGALRGAAAQLLHVDMQAVRGVRYGGGVNGGG